MKIINKILPILSTAAVAACLPMTACSHKVDINMSVCQYSSYQNAYITNACKPASSSAEPGFVTMNAGDHTINLTLSSSLPVTSGFGFLVKNKNGGRSEINSNFKLIHFNDSNPEGKDITSSWVYSEIDNVWVLDDPVFYDSTGNFSITFNLKETVECCCYLSLFH